MSSLRRKEGYYQVDHRESPGNALAAEGKQFEAAVYVCAHCHYTVVIEPKRTRERGYCPGCDSKVCDPCEYKRAVLMEGCTNLWHRIEKMREEIIKQESLIKLGII